MDVKKVESPNLRTSDRCCANCRYCEDYPWEDGQSRCLEYDVFTYEYQVCDSWVAVK